MIGAEFPARPREVLLAELGGRPVVAQPAQRSRGRGRCRERFHRPSRTAPATGPGRSPPAACRLRSPRFVEVLRLVDAHVADVRAVRVEDAGRDHVRGDLGPEFPGRLHLRFLSRGGRGQDRVNMLPDAVPPVLAEPVVEDGPDEAMDLECRRLLIEAGEGEPGDRSHRVPQPRLVGQQPRQPGGQRGRRAAGQQLAGHRLGAEDGPQFQQRPGDGVLLLEEIDVQAHTGRQRLREIVAGRGRRGDIGQAPIEQPQVVLYRAVGDGLPCRGLEDRQGRSPTRSESMSASSSDRRGTRRRSRAMLSVRSKTPTSTTEVCHPSCGRVRSPERGGPARDPARRRRVPTGSAGRPGPGPARCRRSAASGRRATARSARRTPSTVSLMSSLIGMPSCRASRASAARTDVVCSAGIHHTRS